MHAPHKTAINLQFGQRQGVQLAETSVTGAKVVKGNPATQLTEPEDSLLNLVNVLHDSRFGDFQIKS
ncbi:hypothetical protein ALP22_200182 [Pseudomonas coronafaciens pv. porri]|nr:hypothetical protein ALP22_200182 [Pseudomonas coronafaciens pv. porri]